MPKEFIPQRLDVQAFAEQGAELSGTDRVGSYPRLLVETRGRNADQPLSWHARGELRKGAGQTAETWLHLQVQTVLSLDCQRCLGPVGEPVTVDRSFRFVADEATAEAEDESVEEDLLALSRQFDLRALIEDEVLLEMPLVPRHDECPEPVPMRAGEAPQEAEAERPNPFAVLGRLKGGSDR